MFLNLKLMVDFRRLQWWTSLLTIQNMIKTHKNLAIFFTFLVAHFKS